MIPIRQLIKEDRSALEKMLGQIHTFDNGEINAALSVIDDALNSPQKKYNVLCAHLHQGPLLGFIAYGALPRTDNCSELYWIFVDKKFTRRGIGSELMLSMEEELIRTNSRRVYVTTASTPHFEPARIFFEKCGFQVDSILDDFYRVGDDKIILRKEL
jgi:GNAT superfamily N-acetyltransferase